MLSCLVSIFWELSALESLRIIAFMVRNAGGFKQHSAPRAVQPLRGAVGLIEWDTTICYNEKGTFQSNIPATLFIAERFRRIGSSGTRGVGGDREEPGITVLCPLSPPLGLLVVAGDSDGRLGLWTTSISSSVKG